MTVYQCGNEQQERMARVVACRTNRVDGYTSETECKYCGPARGTLFAAEERRMQAMRRHGPEARKLIRKGEYEAAADLMINKGLMSPDEAVAYIKRKVVPMMIERQITEFYLHASSLDKMRLEHQLEALKER